MIAWRAYRFIYGRLVAPLDDDARIEVDALLGDEVAKAERERRRHDAVLVAGVEVG